MVDIPGVLCMSSYANMRLGEHCGSELFALKVGHKL